MAHQEEGWPLDLHPLNERVGLPRNGDFSGTVSFNTGITGSPTSCTDSSSDLDTESTGSFFHDRSITLGSLIGVSSILQLSRRSVRVRNTEVLKDKKIHKRRTWLFSLCSRDNTDAANVTPGPSLGQFLAVERRSASYDHSHRRDLAQAMYGLDELSFPQPPAEENSLFVDGWIAAPQSSSWIQSDVERSQNKGIENGNGIGCAVPILFSCLCCQATH